MPWLTVGVICKTIGYANGRMRDELLNETLFISMAHARVEIAAWAEDCSKNRPSAERRSARSAAYALRQHISMARPLKFVG